ncbi:lipase/acyltransferase domain-containing protein [Arthrobacter sp. B1I2]|uniref:lipase/acyltransferase domain-containing protein n=1 Tax=Arthrobacter sp. B1I2 TaxID=3042263 RepID=UPI0027D90A45|nr:hypothetical protein [Arthrobacter sp. B1I2]
MGRIAGYEYLLKSLARSLNLTAGNAFDDAPANLIAFPYDWRLSCRYNARQLKAVVDRKLQLWRIHSGEPGAKVILIAHSMGGLVARYYLEVTGDAEDRGDGQWRKCRALFSFGTPYRGSIDAVGYVANGYKKLFHDFTEMLRSCPSVYELMPVYRAINHNGTWKRPYDIDIPNATPGYLNAAKVFHDEIKAATAMHARDPDYAKDAYKTFPLVGVGQTTLQSANFSGSSLSTSWTVPESIDNLLAGGDGTVPRVSATPIELSEDQRETFLGERHGFLQSSATLLDDLFERVKQVQSRGLAEIQGGGQLRLNPIDLLLDDLYEPNEPIVIRARVGTMDPAHTLVADIQQVEGLQAGPPDRHFLAEGLDHYHEAKIEGLSPGRYTVTVGTDSGRLPRPTPVHGTFDVVGKVGW